MEGNNNNGGGGCGRGARSGAGYGGGGRRGYGRRGNYQQQGQHQSSGDRMIRPVQPHDRAYPPPVTGRGRGNHTQMVNNSPPAQQWAYRPQVQRQGGANGLPVAEPGSSGGATGVGRRGGTWSSGMVLWLEGAPPPRPQVAVAAQIELPVIQPVNYSDTISDVLELNEINFSDMISEVPELNGVNYSDTISDVPELNGDNYKVWKERVTLLLGLMDINYAIRKDEPPSITENSIPDAVDRYEKWERSNRLCVMFIKTKISAEIRGSVQQYNNVCALLKAIDDQYGPCGGQVASGLEVDTNLTEFTAHVLEPPTVKLGNSITAKLDPDKSLVKGIPILRWALLDFSADDRCNWLKQDKFISELMNRCKDLGVRMENPLATRSTNMEQLRTIEDVRGQLGEVIQEASHKSKERLQVIVCVLAHKHPGYDLLKLVSETEIGVLTQCCLSGNANKDRNDRFLANLALKMNAKVGGINFELDKPLRKAVCA